MEAFFIGLFTIILGLAFTLAGYQFFRILMPIWGFFAGFAWGAQAIAIGLGQGFLATATGWFVGLIIGLILASLAYLFYELAVGILVGSVGYWLSMALLTAIGFSQGGFFATILSLAVAVAVGVGVLYLHAPKGLLVALSAFAGATAVIGGLLVMFGTVPVAFLGTDIISAIIGQSFLWILVWAALVAGGVVTQLEISRSMGAEAEGYDISDYSGASYGSIAGAKGGTATKSTTTEEVKDDNNNTETTTSEPQETSEKV